MSTMRTFLKTGLLSLLLLGGATLAEAQQNGNQGGQGNGISRQASGSDGSRRNDTNYENLGALCDSLQSALNLTDIDVVPVESTGQRHMKRFDEAALRQTLTEMYEALGIEVELPSRFKPSDLGGIFTEILVAAAESTPSVQTIVADGFTTSLAILRGAVTNDGNQALTAWGFKFGTDSDLGDSIHVAFGDYQSFLDTSAQDTGAFMLEKSGLDRYTTYYYAAWAENANGITHGDTMSFMTLPDLASGLALDTSLVTATSATLELAISDAGGQGPDDVGFYWDDADFTLDAFAGDSLPSDSASGTAHSVQVTGLTRMTTYYFNAYADNLAGRAWADEHFAFTTKPEVPEFDTLYADLTVDSLYALLADDGGQTPSLSRFIYSTTSNAELVTDSVDGVLNGLSFSAPIASASLLPSQDYDLNAFVENAAGRATAEASSFFTPALVFTNDSVADITDNTGSLMASFTFGNRMPDAFGFKWGLAADLSDATVSPVSLAADSTIRLDLDGLSKDSTYYYAAYADNGTVQFGDTLSFLAMTIYAPTVLADTAQLITSAGATLSGDVDDNGGADVTGFGFIWGTDASLADATEVEGDSTSATGFSKALTGLEPETTYYYAAFATNEVGTGYSDTLSFTTPPWACGSPWDYNDVSYETVEAFGDCWFAQNLATDRFANGDSIPTGLSETDWEMTLDPAWVSLGENAEEQASYVETYGALYNFLAVNDARGLCPTGWHVASSQEWWDLKDSLVDPSSASEIKAIPPTWNGTNETGINLLPGGYYRPNISYDNTDGEMRAYVSQSFEEYANVWTASASSSGTPIAYSIGGFLNGGQFSLLQMGRTVRCVKGDMGPVEVLAPVIQPQHIHVDSTGATAAVIAFGITEDWDNAITQAKVRIGEDRSTTETFVALSLEADTIQIEVTDLSPGTQYWYQAIAYSGDKIGYGYWQTFTTSLDVPTMGTLAATDLAPASATLNGSVDGDGGEELSATGFIWGTNASLDTTTSVAGSGTSGSFTAALTGLDPATTYYYSAFGTNSVGTAYGDTLSFETPSSIAPEVTTSEATDISAFTGVLNGTVGYDGGAEVTATGFVWSADLAFTTPQDIAGSATSGDFSAEIMGLTLDSTYYYTAYATNEAGTAYGDTLSFTAAEPPFLCGSAGALYYNGHNYGTIHRGNQCWFAENLATETYANGDTIPMVTSGWNTTTTAARTPMDNDVANVELYGWLYNWFAVADTVRGLCPTDWHVSTDEDWQVLEDGLGATYAGRSLKSKSTDTPPWNGQNSIGFSALPGGYRSDGGTHTNGGVHGYFWTSTEATSTKAWDRYIYDGQDNINRNSYNKRGGLAVRCVKFYPARPPVTVSMEAEVLGQTSAKLYGTTLANGGGNVTTRGFKYSTDPDLTNPTTRTGSGVGDFYSTVTGLSIGTTYYYTAYASNSYGTAYGDTLSFTTEDYYLPVTSTVSATVNYTQLILEGSYTNVGGDEITAAGFLYSEDAGLQGATQVNDTSSNATFRQVLVLQPQTTYYFTAFATSSAGTAYGDTLTATTTAEYVPGDSLVFNGNVFSVSKLGNQVWMESNLETDTYANGDPIPTLDATAWGLTTEGAQAWVDDDPAAGAGRGRLYNGYAAMDPRGLCPTGWHVATNTDFTTLIANNSYIENGDGTYSYDSDFQARIKSSPSDVPSWNGTNTTGLSFPPTGYRYINGTYYNQTTESKIIMRIDDAIYFSSLNEAGGSFSTNGSVSSGLYRQGGTVRCVMDPCVDENGNGVCDFDDVEGCTNNNAENYNPNATADNGSCVYASFEACGFPFVFNGVGYSTVQIGDQCWFAENLRTSLYADGTAIPDTASDRYGQPYQIEYSSYELNAKFGKAYNLAAVNDPRGLCPTGWEVPSSLQFTELINFAGGSSVAGAALKAAPSDGSRNWNGTNDYGFGALGGGMGYNPGTEVSNFYTYGRFWLRNTNWYDTGYYYEGWTAPTGWSGSIQGGYINGALIRMEQGLNSATTYGERPYVATSVRCICVDSNDNGLCDVAEVHGCMRPDAENFNPAATYNEGCTFAPFNACGDYLTHNGYGYATTQIGDQCWFAENLRTTEYTDGTAITDFADSEGVAGPLTRGYSDDATTMLYGQLYNGNAVRSANGLCPSGWHVPSYTEWNSLKQFLGSTVDGQKLKSSPEDVPEWDGTNTSGFSALPTGRANYANNYYNVGYLAGVAHYWTTYESGSSNFVAKVIAGTNSSSSTNLSTSDFASVRCLKD